MQLGNAIAWQCICATGYAAAILAFGGESISLMNALVNDWLAFSHSIVRTALFFLPEPVNPTDTPGPAEIYQHLIVSSLLIACVWILALRTSWGHWTNEIYPHSDRHARPWSQPDLLQHSSSVMILGSLSATLLLLFLGTGSKPADSWLAMEKWTYLRAPLLGTAVFVFACKAIAIGRLRQELSSKAV
jgi:hypothetical protein